MFNFSGALAISSMLTANDLGDLTSRSIEHVSSINSTKYGCVSNYNKIEDDSKRKNHKHSYIANEMSL